MGSASRQFAAERFIEQFGEVYKKDTNRYHGSIWKALGIHLSYDDLNGVVNQVLIVQNTETLEEREIILQSVYDAEFIDPPTLAQYIAQDTGMDLEEVNRRLATL